MKFLISFIIISTIMVACSRAPTIIDSAKMQKIFFDAQFLAKDKKGFPCVSLEEVSDELIFWFLKANTEDITSYKYPSSSANSERDIISIYIQLKNNYDAHFLLDVKIKNDEADIVCYDLMKINH